ncbi:MAG TPA: LytTR family DNA-binding domain-containing protein [Candidatus Odoribacter faecigallinarum]|jgi:DNA-binding LytR/AlgR family response regulator|uniref:LytTR family DNA-binding domain-containing protein n=1 Tax=Candidatus Odoribacter faecigallinarum TaxID=2838706 RepID=A0A9D1V132_9BACT|nr:LytTR family DNA-binding domain-containing protein [Candidatus Odoribacter faecigallinarum]
MNLNCLIVDDEPLAVELLEAYVKRTPFLELKGAFTNAFDALALLEKETLDLLFLDIQMPELNGLELSRLVGTQVKVIFTTAFEQYAVEGFKVDALDYLLKPISYPEFLRAAHKALRWKEMAEAASSLEVREIADALFVRSGNKFVKVQLSHILYIEGMQDYVKIYLDDNSQPVVTLNTMKDFEESLSFPFLRIHRSYIINFDKVTMVERNRVFLGGTYVSVSDTYKEQFLEQINRKTLK